MAKMRKFIFPTLIGIFLLALAACGGEESSEGYSFEFQYACINRTLLPCELMAEPGGLVDSINEATNGQVKIEISSFPELGLGGPDTLRLIEDGTLSMGEIYSGYVGGDYPPIDAANLW